MELKDLLSEAITVANNILSERGGNPDNFDLEELVETLESFYEELDEIGEFYYYEDGNEGYDFEDEDY